MIRSWGSARGTRAFRERRRLRDANPRDVTWADGIDEELPAAADEAADGTIGRGRNVER